MKKRKRLSRKTKSILLLVFIVLFIIFFIIYLNTMVNPVIVEASEAKVRSVSQKALSSAVLSSISNNDTYNHIVEYRP